MKLLTKKQIYRLQVEARMEGFREGRIMTTDLFQKSQHCNTGCRTTKCVKARKDIGKSDG